MMSSIDLDSVSFLVHGRPLPKGSMRGFIHGGRVILTSATKGLKKWEAAVELSAKAIFDRPAPWSGPVKVTMDFEMPRPKYHYGTGRNAETIKDSAPFIHSITPDLDKLERAVLDGMTGVVFDDDCQVCSICSYKIYGDRDGLLKVTATLVEEG